MIAGAAYFPALEEIIVAAPGEGAWWNGSRAAVSGVSELSAARLVTTDARFNRDPSRRDRWLQLQNGAQAMRTWGDCYGYLLVATGRADVMVDDVISVWDGAALLPVAADDARPDAISRLFAHARIPWDDARRAANDSHRCDGHLAKGRACPVSAGPCQHPRSRRSAATGLRMLRDLETGI